MPSTNESDEAEDFDPDVALRLKAETDAAEAALRSHLGVLDAARRQFARSKNDENRTVVEAAQAEADVLHNAFAAALERLRGYLGITEEDLAEVEAGRTSGMDQLPRAALTADLVEVTADLDATLPQALEAIEALLPSEWLGEEPPNAARLNDLRSSDGVLSITKGLRPESEDPPIHRLRQAIYNARDYLRANPAYDHFAGATHIPTLAQLGAELEHLRAVGGDVEGRLRKLWAGTSRGVDATFLELLTAARCVGRGRSVAFIEETSEKTPDLECSDPFPLVIECKRQDALSPFELEEEAIMRAIFVRVRHLARAKGLAGRYELRLSVEAKNLEVEEVAGAIFRQRLSAHSDQPLSYPWGTVAFEELPRRGRLRDVTVAYSPTMLEQVFGWNTDLPEWDGLCCSIANARGGVIDEVQSPIAILWSNASPQALRKRTWAPSNLFGSATGQIYGGAVGIIYVAYVEGAREEAADLRVAAYHERLKDWEHAGDIRVPISVLSRLYPRPLGDGNPDLIESGVRVLSAEYGDASLFDDFPTTIFTQSSED